VTRIGLAAWILVAMTAPGAVLAEGDSRTPGEKA
jgi:hypothetical protein